MPDRRAVTVTAAPAPAPALRRNRDFLLLWAGAGATLLAVRAAVIAYPLLVLWRTGSASAAGLVASAVLLPQLLAPLPVGVLVDRLDRRRLMILSDVGAILLALAVVALAQATNPWVPLIAAAAFGHGCLAALYQLAERSSVRHVVPQSQLPAALSQNEARTRGAALLGQPAGSGLFALGAAVPFAFNALAHGVSLVLLLFIRRDFRAATTAPRRPWPREVAEGVAWLWRRPFLRTVTVIVAVTNIAFQGITLTLMVLVLDRGGSVALVGVITALAAAGGLVGAVSGGWWMRRFSLRTLVVGSLAAWTAITVAVAGATSWVALGALFAASGYVGGLLTVAGAVYLMVTTPDALLGRVNGVVALVGFGPLALGPILAGALVDRVGTTGTMLTMAAAMGLMLLVALASPAVRGARQRVDELAPASVDAAS